MSAKETVRLTERNRANRDKVWFLDCIGSLVPKTIVHYGAKDSSFIEFMAHLYPNTEMCCVTGRGCSSKEDYGNWRVVPFSYEFSEYAKKSGLDLNTTVAVVEDSGSSFRYDLIQSWIEIKELGAKYISMSPFCLCADPSEENERDIANANILMSVQKKLKEEYGEEKCNEFVRNYVLRYGDLAKTKNLMRFLFNLYTAKRDYDKFDFNNDCLSVSQGDFGFMLNEIGYRCTWNAPYQDVGLLQQIVDSLRPYGIDGRGIDRLMTLNTNVRIFGEKE